jgi:hypothetical protein
MAKTMLGHHFLLACLVTFLKLVYTILDIGIVIPELGKYSKCPLNDYTNQIILDYSKNILLKAVDSIA